MASVKYTGENAPKVSPLSSEDLDNDACLQGLLKVYANKEKAVMKIHNCVSFDLSETVRVILPVYSLALIFFTQSSDNSVVGRAREAWGDVLNRYYLLSTKVCLHLWCTLSQC